MKTSELPVFLSESREGKQNVIQAGVSIFQTTRTVPRSCALTVSETAKPDADRMIFFGVFTVDDFLKIVQHGKIPVM